MEPATTLRFAATARLLAREVQRRRLRAPGFRSPPRMSGVDRTLRRHPNGTGATVAVRVRGRVWVAVLADMIEGVVAANRLTGPPADDLRAGLWSVAGYEAPAPTVERPARVA
jgi:hypothetical protein